MKKLLKILIGLLGLVVLLIIGAVIGVPLFFDPNDFKQQIADAVLEQTGRKLDIDGDIGLTLFPWVGVDVGRVQLSNAAGFAGDYFARTERMKVRVKVMPLLRKQVEMDTVSIEGLDLNLVRNEQGATNWSDLAKESPGSSEGAPPPALALAIGGVDLSNASVSWSDALAPSNVSMKDLSVETGPLALGAPLTLALEFNVQSDEPKLTGHIKAAGSFDFDPAAQIAKATDLSVEASLQSPVIPGGSADITLAGNALFNQIEQALSLTGFKLSIPKLQIADLTSSVSAQGDFAGNLATGKYGSTGLTVDGTLSGANVPGGSLPFKLTTALDVDLPQQTLIIKDYTLATGELGVRGDLKAEKLIEAPAFSGKLAVAPFNLRQLMTQLGQKVPDTADPKTLGSVALQTEFAGSASSLSLKPLALSLDDTKFEGDLAIANFAAPAIKLNLAGDALDADRYLPPATEAATPGAAAPAAAELPVKTLRALDVSAKLVLGKLRVSGLDLEQVAVALEAKDGLIKASPLKAKLYGGSYAGNITVDARGDQARFSVDENLTSVRFGPLLAALAIEPGELDLGDAAGNVALKAEMSGDPEKQIYDLKGASFKADVTGKGLPGGKLVARADADLTLDLAKQNVAGKNVSVGVENLKLPNGLTATGTAIVKSLTADLKAKAYSGNDVNVKLRDLQLNPKARGTNLQLAVNRLDADLGKETLVADGFTLDGLGMQASGNLAVAQLLGAPEIAGQIDVPSIDLKQVLQSLGQSPIETADPSALTNLSVRDTTFKASPDNITLDPFTLLLDPSPQDNARPKVSGLVNLRDFKAPKGQFDLVATFIDADRYLPPRAQGQAATPGAVAAALPLELIRGLNLDGKLSIKKLIFSGLTLTEINVVVNAKDGQLKAQPLNALLYGGTYTGNINVDARGEAAQVSVDEQLDRVHIGPLLRDLTGEEKIAGRGGAHIRATASGQTTDHLKQTLNGQTAFALEDGYITGIDILSKACTLLSTLKLADVASGGLTLENLLGGAIGVLGATATGGQEDTGRTEFAELSGSANIVQGIAHNEDLVMKSPMLRVAGQGDIDLVREQLDYLSETALVASCEGQGGRGTDELADLTFVVSLKGPLADPETRLENMGEIQQKALSLISGDQQQQQQTGTGLETILPGIVLPGSGEQSQPEQQQQQQTGTGLETILPGIALPGSDEQSQPEQPSQQDQSQPQQKEPEDLLKDTLEGIFQ